MYLIENLGDGDGRCGFIDNYFAGPISLQSSIKVGLQVEVDFSGYSRELTQLYGDVGIGKDD